MTPRIKLIIAGCVALAPIAVSSASEAFIAAAIVLFGFSWAVK